MENKDTTSLVASTGTLFLIASFVAGVYVFVEGVGHLMPDEGKADISEAAWRIAIGLGLLSIPVLSGMLVATY